MTTANIQNSFAATGIVPYNPERVLSKLHIQLRTPTPPLIPILEQEKWVPETPHNTTEVNLQAKAIETYLKRRTQSPPSPTNIALSQLVKGCQIAMNSAIILAEENRQLRLENARQVKKRAKRRMYIAHGGTLTVAEGQALVQCREDKEIGEVVDIEEGPSQPKKRAPPKCSICKSETHTARTHPIE